MVLDAEMDESLSALEQSMSKLEDELQPLLATPWEQLSRCCRWSHRLSSMVFPCSGSQCLPAPLLSLRLWSFDSKLEPMEKAKLNLIIAYVADSLFYMFLKTQV
jgi:hypothetical protein